MAYDEYLAERLRRCLNGRAAASIEEKKMMGGLCFMVNDKMCVGVVKNQLMARIDPDQEQDALKRNGARPMDFTGRPMKGFVFVSPEGIDQEDDLEYWVSLCLNFNPKAKSSKRKKKT